MNWWSWLMVMVGVPCVTGIWAHPNLRDAARAVEIALTRRHDRRRNQCLISEVGMLEDVRVAHHDLLLESGQPINAVAERAPCVVVRAAVPKGADPHIHARRQHLRRGIIRGRVELDRLERATVGKVLGKRTRIRAGVERELPDTSMRALKRHVCQRAEFAGRSMDELGMAPTWYARQVWGRNALVADRDRAAHPVVDRAEIWMRAYRARLDRPVVGSQPAVVGGVAGTNQQA
jgi:hypothetical protein